jgi:murein DD-endopeptidase MepM/ murein hydrolase activator NlpD
VASRNYDILILPDRGLGERRFRVSSLQLRTLGVALTALVTLIAILLSSYQTMMGEIDRNGEYRRENFALRRDLTLVSERIEEVNTRLRRRKILVNAFNQILAHQDILNGVDEARIEDFLATPLLEARLNRAPSLPSDFATEDEEASGSLGDLSEALTSTVQERTNREIGVLNDSLDELQSEILGLEDNVEFNFEFLRDQQAFLMALPTIMPAQGQVTSGFGVRRSRLDRRILMHEGLDVANKAGTPIVATANGVVRDASTKTNYGRTVVIQHGYGVETWYTHAQKLLVSAGQRVNRGQKIALMGKTGSTSTVHVHYEVKVGGVPVDPMHYIFSEARVVE